MKSNSNISKNKSTSLESTKDNIKTKSEKSLKNPFMPANINSSAKDLNKIPSTDSSKKINEHQWGVIVSTKKMNRLSPEELARLLAEKRKAKQKLGLDKENETSKEKEEKEQKQEKKEEKEEKKEEKKEVIEIKKENPFKEDMNIILGKIKANEEFKKVNNASYTDKFIEQLKSGEKFHSDINNVKMLSKSMERMIFGNIFNGGSISEKSKMINMTFREKVYEFDKNEQIKTDFLMEQKRNFKFSCIKKSLSKKKERNYINLSIDKNIIGKDALERLRDKILPFEREKKYQKIKQKYHSSSIYSRNFPFAEYKIKYLHKYNSAGNTNKKNNQKNKNIIKDDNEINSSTIKLKLINTINKFKKIEFNIIKRNKKDNISNNDINSYFLNMTNSKNTTSSMSNNYSKNFTTKSTKHSSEYINLKDEAMEKKINDRYNVIKLQKLQKSNSIVHVKPKNIFGIIKKNRMKSLLKKIVFRDVKEINNRPASVSFRMSRDDEINKNKKKKIIKEINSKINEMQKGNINRNCAKKLVLSKSLSIELFKTKK